MTDFTLERIDLFKYFLESVVSHFGFMEEMHYNYSILSDGHILYSSKNVEVNIYYERISFEMYLVVTLREWDISCTIDDILQFSCDSGIVRQYRSATNKELLEKGVREMKDYLKAYGMDFLIGNIVAFKDIQKREAEEHKRLTLNSKLLEAEKYAVSAWNNKDYATVIQIYGSISEHLTSVQKKRLELCAKMVN